MDTVDLTVKQTMPLREVTLLLQTMWCLDADGVSNTTLTQVLKQVFGLTVARIQLPEILYLIALGQAFNIILRWQ